MNCTGIPWRFRPHEGREDEPSACVIDSQSIKTSANVPAAGQGIDVGRNSVGRKRALSSTLGPLLAVLVTAASVQDSVAGQALIEKVAAEQRIHGPAPPLDRRAHWAGS